MLLTLKPLSRILSAIWIVNCILASVIAIRQVWIPYMSASGDAYGKIESAPFDGTTLPIAYIPDWTKPANQDKSKRFEDIEIQEFIPLPQYDALSLLDDTSLGKSTTILRYTYITTYMGTYKLDYHEYEGGHLGVDIRAPIGTPVLSIANGVVVRTVEADLSGNKFIVVRHDKVPMNGEFVSLYSGYLHLSEILVKEGDLVRKGDMIGRVGITGITTTPHLHIQIDTSDAPFHPYWHFTTAESRSRGLSFFDAVNTGLNKDKAARYTIHPMNFINRYLGGVTGSRGSDIQIQVDTPSIQQSKSISIPIPEKTESTIASQIIAGDFDCIGKRFNDVSLGSSFGKSLYPLVDRKCLFDELGEKFGTKDMITYREALVNTMRYFGIEKANGTSHFLDIPLGDIMQGYALVAYRKGILTGNYAYPTHIMTREEMARLIVQVADIRKNPSGIRVYRDVDPMNPNYPFIQDYALAAGVRTGKFFPKSLVTRGMFVQMLSNIKENH